MERMMSVEEKIRRAEEIYAKRRGENARTTATVKLNENSNQKDIKLLKRMIIQIIVCIVIYFIVYIINNSQFIFSEDFIKKVNEILSYDTNFVQIYENCKNFIIGIIPNLENNPKDTDNQNTNVQDSNLENLNNKNEEIQNTNQDQTNNLNTNAEAIGGASNEQVSETENEQITEDGQNVETTQDAQDIQNVKNTTTFIKPLEGTITSVFGMRDPSTETVPKNHTGIDIAANLGTKIKSATGGEVVLASEEGDYGKHLKIQIGEVSIIYAHCNALYVKQGDIVMQGQEIAEVGSTGNSTGPHLHFEIRYQERTIDPQKILDL